MAMNRHNGDGKRGGGKRIKVVKNVLGHIFVLKSHDFFLEWLIARAKVGVMVQA